MSLQHTPLGNFGEAAHPFSLTGTDGNLWTLDNCRGENGLLVMFISNHCPYVKAIRPKLVRDCKELLELGVSAVAIMPNDTVNYPADSMDNMRSIAGDFGFPFPYVLDETQEVARQFEFGDRLRQIEVFPGQGSAEEGIPKAKIVVAGSDSPWPALWCCWWRWAVALNGRFVWRWRRWARTSWPSVQRR